MRFLHKYYAFDNIYVGKVVSFLCLGVGFWEKVSKKPPRLSPNFKRGRALGIF
jgi:hypothetical protein